MAPIFDYNDIKVDFVSTHLENAGKRYIAKSIVYPVLRYKILAPVIEDLQLNIFQKSILSLLNKGNYDIQKIANWLKLDTQLVQIVIAELNIKGFLQQNVITESGRKIVENTFSWFNNGDNLRKDIYYIYQDVFTSKLYPIVSDIDPANDFWEYKKGQIQIQSKGERKNIRATLIEPKGIDLSQIRIPEINEILNVIKSYSDIGKSQDVISPKNLIQFIDSSPDLTYLSTIVYMRNDDTSIDDIKVLDPFVKGRNSYFLYESFIVAYNKNYKLKGIIDEMILGTDASGFEQFSEILRWIHDKATGQADILFGNEKNRYKNLYKSMIDLYKDFSLYSNHKDGKYLKEALKNSQTVLETLFEYIYREHSKGYVTIKLNKKLSNADSDIIAKKALSINQEIVIPSWGFKNIAGINDVLKNKNSSLRPKYMAALLASEYDESNPMHLLMSEKKDLLVLLENVSTGRNKVGHKYVDIPNSDMDAYYDEVESIHIKIEEIIRIFLGGK